MRVQGFSQAQIMLSEAAHQARKKLADYRHIVGPLLADMLAEERDLDAAELRDKVQLAISELNVRTANDSRIAIS